MTPEQIKKLRTDRGMTQLQMAVLLGSSVASVQRWESGRSKPTRLSLAGIQQKIQAYDEDRKR
jgi:DNA-binding transcriptional regulator YiaG